MTLLSPLYPLYPRAMILVRHRPGIFTSLFQLPGLMISSD